VQQTYNKAQKIGPISYILCLDMPLWHPLDTICFQ
jgi:hypothetical protein